MEARGIVKSAVTLDVTLTWIEKILGRLQLLVHDYPGLNNLKLELVHLQTILPRACARYLSSEQLSILSPFSEKLQNFFFLLRSEDRILYVMAEEISSFQESVKSLRGQILERNTIMFDSILDKLQPLVGSYPRDDHGLSKLRVELKLTKTVCLCLINSREQISKKTSISEVKSAIYEKASQFYYHLLRLEEAKLDPELAEAFSIFRESLKEHKQQIHELYTSMSDIIDHSSPWPTCELVEFFDSLLESLANIIIQGEANDPTIENLIEPLHEKLIFLKNFLCLATLGVEDPSQLEQFFIHCQVSAVNAAKLCYTCWFYGDDDQVYNNLLLRSSELMEKIKPINNQAPQNYVDTLRTSWQSISSFLLREVPDIHIVGDFVDSLLQNLWEFLDCGANFLVSMELQMQMLGEGLKFLRTILKQQQEKFYGLQEDMKHDVIDVVYKAADIIFQLYKLRGEEGLASDMDIQVFNLMTEIDCIKVAVAKQFPVSSTSNLPITSELELIDHVLENLKELASHQVHSIFSDDDRIRQVQNGLKSLRPFLENIQEHALWRSSVEVAYKAEFVIDSLTARGMSSYSLMLLDALAKEIMSFIETSEIDDEKNASPAQKASKISSRVPSQGRSASNEIVVGFDKEAEAIIDLLTTEKKGLAIVFIVGMPGIGKTTLARKVFQDSKVTDHFRVRAWSHVSQVCSRKDVLLEIWRSIVPEQSNQDNEKNENDLAEILHRRLKVGRYLIVLDDIWDIEAWHALELFFPRNACGSRILLTGRSHFSFEPAPTLFPLRQLTDDECWKLLQTKLNYDEDFSPCLREIGWRIAKNCKGLPFSVIIVAGILANLEEVAWEEVANSLSSSVVGGTEGKTMLELSYRHLPDILKPCLLYMAAFPHGQEISVQRLMWLWIAEGFAMRSELKGVEDIAEKNEWKDLEGIAEDNIMALLNRNLVMVAKQGSTGKMKTCQIHDLLQEFCLVKSKEENFLQMINGRGNLLKFNEPPNLRRLSIYSQPRHFAKSGLFCPRIRSLLFHSQGAGSSVTPYSLCFVFRVKLLSVLDLEQINLGFVFPDAIATLVHLRYLAVRGGMKCIPPSIAKLSHLETLLVTTNHKGPSGFSLPVTLWDMQQLRHLWIHGCLVDLSLVQDNLESSSSLDNLTTFSTPKLDLGQTTGRIMMKFPNLRKLKCSFLGSGTSKGDGEEIVVIKFPSRLEMLKLHLGKATNVVGVKFDFPSNLKKLTLMGFSWSMISSIWKLANLQVLKLLNGSNDGVEEWQMEEEEEQQQLPKLEFLKLECDIARWTGYGDHFPCLRILVLEGCNYLEELPSCLESQTTLDLIKVHRCPVEVGDLVRGIEDQLKYNGNEGVKIVISAEFEED